MKAPKQLSAYMNTPMNRQEFLKHLAVGMLFVAGGGMIANALGLTASQEDKKAVKATSYGYGASTYGGSSVKG